MIRRYEPTETVFKHNKFVLHPLTAFIREEANGLFELEMELKKDEIINKRDIVVAPSQRGEQPFRVYRIVKSLLGKKVFARHIFYDLANAFLIDTRPTNATVQDALQSIFTVIGSQGFTYLSDIVDRRTAYYIRKNPVEAIIGAENSILNTWGGNIVRDNKEIKILAEGIDRGFEIRLGKNLIGIEDDSDDSNVVTRLYPTVVIDQVVHALPELYVDSPLIGAYPQPIVKETRIELTEEQSLMTMENIYTLMRDYCQALYNINNVDKPIANYKVDFVQLKKIARLDQDIHYTVGGLEQLTYQTIETLTYADLEGTYVINQFIDLLEQLDLYDLVKIKVKELGINLQARVISYKFDCLRERFESIELGGYKPGTPYQTSSIIQKLANDLQVSKSDIAKLWDVAVNVVTGNKGGYKVERLNANNEPYETLYMDTPDINTAVNVLRINNAGIAGSSNGFNGPYEVAITTDGWIVAERILAYQLSAISANLGTVIAGRIQDADNESYWDLDGKEIKLNVTELKINSVDVANQMAETKLTAEGALTKVSNMQIGGRNLLRNSGFDQGYLEWSKNTGYEAIYNGSGNTNIEGANMLLTAPANISGRGVYQFYNNFIVGKQYTYSAWMYVEDLLWFGCAGQNIDVAPGGWKRVSITFTATATSHPLYIIFHDSNDSAAAYVDNVQLEEGNQATSWSPAPEDTDGKITTVKTTVDGHEIEVAKYTQGKLVGQTYNFTGSSFDIGGKTGDVAKHTNSESRYNHSDGSYTKIGSSGLERVIGAAGQKYHYLISRGAVYDSFNPSSNIIEYTRTITLPSDFKNKDVTVALSLRTFGTDDASGYRTTDYVITAQELTYGAFNVANGTFQFNARFCVKRISTSVPAIPYSVGFTVEYLAVV